MNGSFDLVESRRAFLKLVGSSSLLIPLIGMCACTKQAPASTIAASSPEGAPPSAAQPAPMQATNSTQAPRVANATTGMGVGEFPRLDQSEPAARSLSYNPDAGAVDSSKYPQHMAGQACRNCVLFKGAASDAWGLCEVFPR